MEELIIKHCPKCGNTIKVIGELKCESLSCCGDTMETLTPNSIDASIEKHVPTYEVKDNKLLVSVNHGMEDEHLIEWICFKTKDTEEFKYLKDEAKAEFAYKPGILYSYCNKHGLWSCEVK